jgi:hypothetical protein
LLSRQSTFVYPVADSAIYTLFEQQLLTFQCAFQDANSPSVEASGRDWLKKFIIEQIVSYQMILTLFNQKR